MKDRLVVALSKLWHLLRWIICGIKPQYYKVGNQVTPAEGRYPGNADKRLAIIFGGNLDKKQEIREVVYSGKTIEYVFTLSGARLQFPSEWIDPEQPCKQAHLIFSFMTAIGTCVLALVALVPFIVPESDSQGSMPSTSSPGWANVRPLQGTPSNLTPVENYDDLFDSKTLMHRKIDYNSAQNLIVHAHDQMIDIYDGATNEVIQTVYHSRELNFVEFSSNGKYLLAADGIGGLLLFDIETRRKIVLSTGTDEAIDIDFATDSRFAVLTRDETLIIWDIIDNNPVIYNKYSLGEVVGRAIAFSPEQNIIAFLFRENSQYKVQFINTITSNIISEVILDEEIFFVKTLKFNHRADLVAYATDGGDVSLLKVDTGETIHLYNQGRSGSIIALEFSPDDRFIASLSVSKGVRVMNLETGIGYEFDDLLPSLGMSFLDNTTIQVILGYQGERQILEIPDS